MSRKRSGTSAEVLKDLKEYDRHPLDLGYGKRHTRGDTKYEQKRKSVSANSHDMGAARDLEHDEMEEVVVDIDEDLPPRTKSQGKSRAKSRSKSVSSYTETVKGTVEDSDDTVGTTMKATTKTQRGKTARSTNAIPATPRIVRAKAPARNSTSRTSAAPATPLSNSIVPNKYGFKPPSGPRKPSTEKAKGRGRAKKVVQDDAEFEVEKTKRQTRRSSVALEQVEKEIEKQKNIGLRLRSGDGK
jgi:hypothetical protein